MFVSTLPDALLAVSAANVLLRQSPLQHWHLAKCLSRHNLELAAERAVRALDEGFHVARHGSGCGNRDAAGVLAHVAKLDIAALVVMVRGVLGDRLERGRLTRRTVLHEVDEIFRRAAAVNRKRKVSGDNLPVRVEADMPEREGEETKSELDFGRPARRAVQSSDED